MSGHTTHRFGPARLIRMGPDTWQIDLWGATWIKVGRVSIFIVGKLAIYRIGRKLLLGRRLATEYIARFEELDLGRFPSHQPGKPISSAFLIALGDEPAARAAVGPKSRWG